MNTKLDNADDKNCIGLQTEKKTDLAGSMNTIEPMIIGTNACATGLEIDYKRPVMFTLTDLGPISEVYSMLKATATANGILNVCWQANSTTSLNTLYWCVAVNGVPVNRDYVKCSGSYIYTGAWVKSNDVIEITYPTAMEWMEANTYIRVFVYVGITYSKNEQVVGRWIDGKPIYRRVVEITTGAAARTNNPILDLTGWNIDTVVSMDGSYTSLVGAVCPINYYRDESSNITTYINAKGWLSECHGTLANLKNIPGIIIMEYTKTTD